MKSEFKSRPVYLSRSDRIQAHFLTCYISLIIFRYLEKELKEQFTYVEITNKLKEMKMKKYNNDNGYSPLYVRDDLTDALHEIVGFRTDYEIVSSKDMKKYIKKTKVK